MGVHRAAQPPCRSAVPHDRDDRSRAGAGRPAASRRSGHNRRRGACGGHPDGGNGGRVGGRDGVRDLGARGAGHRRDPPGSPAGGRVRQGRRAGRTGARTVPRPTRTRARHRDLARGRDRRHECGTRGITGRRRTYGDRHRQPPLARWRDCRDRRRDRRARPELVPHRGLSQPAARGHADRRLGLEPAGRRRCGRRPRRRRAAGRGSRRADRGDARAGRAPAGRRVRCRPAGRSRADTQGRGSSLAAVGLSRSGDLPPRAPAGDRPGHWAGPHPGGSDASRRAPGAGAPGAGGSPGDRHPIGRDPGGGARCRRSNRA